MATITIRIDDALRDALTERADAERVTLSEYVRDRLQDSVDLVAEDDDRPSDGYAPSTLSEKDRHVLALLHRILGRVLPDDANDVDGDRDYQLERAAVLERGFTQEYWIEFAGIHSELSTHDCKFVMDVLDLFRATLHSMAHLRETDVEVDEQLAFELTYRGFDHNDHREAQMSDYVKHLIDSERWEEHAGFVTGPNRGNSHSRMVDTYSRMLSKYRQITRRKRSGTGRDSYFLSLDQLQEIADSRVHPSNR